MGSRIAPAVAVVAALACGAGAAPGAALADDHAVGFPTVGAPAPYAPAAVEAVPGDTVTFSGSFAAHPLVWDTNDFDTTATGTSRQFAFARPGLFRFHCQIHASMVGSVRVAGNQFATPDFTWAPAAPAPGQAVTFTATGFTDPGGTIARYEWDLDGNGSFESTGAQAARTYAVAGTVSVALRYVDDGHETSPATVHAVTLGSPAPGGGGVPGGGGTPPGGGGTPSTGGGTPSSGGGGSGGGAGAGGSTPSGTGGPSGGSTPAGSAAPGLRLSTRALAFRRGAATVALSITRPGTAKVTLRSGKTVLALGTARVRPGAGHVRVKLTRAGTRRLRRGHTVRASLTAALREAPGHIVTVQRTVTVRLAAR
jgi:plastocyanin